MESVLFLGSNLRLLDRAHIIWAVPIAMRTIAAPEELLMKYTPLKIFFAIVSVLLCQNLCLTFVNTATAEIVFTSTRDGNPEIYVMNSDGSREINLTRNRADDFDPTWSPNGEQILFVSNRDGVRDLYLMNAEGENVERVFHKSAHREQPAWSPDGKMIAYAVPEDHAINIATITGRSEKRLAWIDWGRGNPAWSPDGSEIAYDWMGGGGIRLINLKTDKITVFLQGRKMVMWRPAWSPTGDRLAFAALKWPKNHVGPLRVDDKLTLYVADRDGAWVRHIAKEPVVNHPTWSPDSSEILYERSVDNRRQLFKVDSERGKPRQLTHSGENYLADWISSPGLPVEPTTSMLTTVWGEIKRK